MSDWESLPIIEAYSAGDFVHYWKNLRNITRDQMTDATIGQLVTIVYLAHEQIKTLQPDVPDITSWANAILDSEAA